MFVPLLTTCVAIDLPDPLAEQTVVTSNNNFTLRYLQVAFDERNNYIASPFSIRLALSMFYPVAGAAVQEDLRELFTLPEDEQDAVEQQRCLLADASTGGHLRALSLVLVEETLPLRPSFESYFRDKFVTGLEASDFSDDIPSGATVNSYFRIANIELDDIITEGDVWSLDPFKIMLFNGTSVMAPLAIRFHPGDITPGAFRFVNAPEQMVPMVQAKLRLGYFHCEELRCRAVELPFRQESGLVLMLLLPDDGSVLKDLVNALTVARLQQIDRQLRSTLLDLRMPKFMIREKTDPKKVLKTLGYGGIFEVKDLNVFKEHQKVLLDGFLQHCYINVGEEGAQLVVPTEDSADDQLLVNRPFLYMVRQRSNGNILVIGHFSKYIDPNEQLY